MKTATDSKLIAEYLAKGGKIKRGDYNQPRKSEITFPMTRGSVTHSGRKSASLQHVGIISRKA